MHNFGYRALTTHLKNFKINRRNWVFTMVSTLDYLFYESTSTAEGEAVPIKYEVIVDQVVEVLKSNPGFKLYVTGHSLGVLSSLFAFMASSRDDIPKPVTCVSVASPYVGDKRYRTAFRLSERRGNLRHLRLAN
mmetsp:Transcript_13340/g.20317  ORF Transcript_13340/g.20317 Transcript_13340/m.20317 type:complete len:134 (+) Transcript_13340:155-556(+)